MGLKSWLAERWLRDEIDSRVKLAITAFDDRRDRLLSGPGKYPRDRHDYDRREVLETKGQNTDQDRVKHNYLDEWVQAVNEHGGFGRWRWAVAREPGEVRDVVLRKG